MSKYFGNGNGPNNGRMGNRNNGAAAVQQNRGGNPGSFGSSGGGGGNGYTQQPQRNRANVVTAEPPVIPQDGVYTNERMMFIASTLVGLSVEVTVKNGQTFEGLFKTFSTGFDMVIVLGQAKRGLASSMGDAAAPVSTTIIINCSDIVFVKVKHLDYSSSD